MFCERRSCTVNDGGQYVKCLQRKFRNISIAMKHSYLLYYLNVSWTQRCPGKPSLELFSVLSAFLMQGGAFPWSTNVLNFRRTHIRCDRSPEIGSRIRRSMEQRIHATRRICYSILCITDCVRFFSRPAACQSLAVAFAPPSRGRIYGLFWLWFSGIFAKSK